MGRPQYKVAAPVMLALLLSACGSHEVRRDAPAQESPRPKPAVADTRSDFARACAPTRKHDESLYTPGGLYAPGVADTAPAQPIDVSGVAEPVPREEPRAHAGNRSPYVVLGGTYEVLDDDEAREYHERGVASWYGTKFNGRATSSGELYDICAFTAAHKTLPLPSYVRVTNLDNGRSLIVRVNDRGPFHDGRVMDLSYAAAVRLGVDRTGTAHVDIQSVRPGETFAAQPTGTLPADPEMESGAQVEQLPEAAPPIPGDQVTVQIGSFAAPENAQRLLDRLQQAGIDAVAIDHVALDGRELWRVRIGPVATADFPALRERLRDLELPEPRVVRD